MAIVRSLLIQVGYALDKKSQNSIEKSTDKVKQNVSGISDELVSVNKETKRVQKTWYGANKRNVLLFSSALFAAKSFANQLYQISNNVISQDILARGLNLTRNELIALNRTAANFGFNEGELSGVIEKFNKRLYDARNGLGSLQDINMRFGISLDPAKKSLDIILDILTEIAKISDEQTRKNVSNGVFGSLGIQFSDLSQDLPGARAQFEKILGERNSIGTDNESLKQFAKSVRGLFDLLTDSTERLASNITPLINSFTEFLKLANQFEQILLNSLSPLRNFLSNFSASRGLENNLRSLTTAVNPLASGLTMNVEINVAPGTTEEQARIISREIERTANDNFLNSFKLIQSDYPRIEN